jgi:predicted secreted hydrolase
MQDGSQVMWAKDRTYNKEGFIQEGAPGNVSFYYSLPRLVVSGNITYMDESGNSKTVEVAGQGWVDRQWGDFSTSAWEWASFRFNNGARVNMYNFDGVHQVGTYQKADGSTQWFDNFTVKQNGYAKAPNGEWFSLGWSYDLPIDIEGSKHFTVVPFSKNDTVHICPTNYSYYEGAARLIDDMTGKHVGSSINECMDIALLHNGPYDKNQH